MAAGGVPVTPQTATSVAEGATAATEEAIAQNGTRPATVTKNGLEKFIPLLIILAFLYFLTR